MTIYISNQRARLDLPYMPLDDIPTVRTGYMSAPPYSGTSAPFDPPLPSYGELVQQQRSLTVKFTPVVVISYPKKTCVQKATATLSRHVVGHDMPQVDEVLARWDLLSGQATPTENNTISYVPRELTMEPSTRKYDLECTLPVEMPETATHKSRRLWYTLETEVSRSKLLFSKCGITTYSKEVVVARRRLMDEQSLLPVNATVPWLDCLTLSVSYPNREMALLEGVAFPVKITVNLSQKRIRLNSIKISVMQNCHNDLQNTTLLCVYSNQHATPDLLEDDEAELRQAREEGFEVKESLLDSTYKGNLLIPGSVETVLDYNLKLEAKTIEKLSASTSHAHPLPVVHKLTVSMRVSKLELTGVPNQKERRYFDLGASTPLVLSRSHADIFTKQTRASHSTEGSLNYHDFLLWEYPRLKNTAFANDFADDSAPSYDSSAGRA
ncbi:hypothetical protein CJU89_4933 [Yarrowia sp. B02]|nr:hypothetical protein CJU89_4933 [Yarrowia sp. B02]